MNKKRNDRLGDPAAWGCLSDEQRDVINKWYFEDCLDRRHDHICCLIMAVVETAILMWKIFDSQYIGLFEFQYINNQNTGNLTSWFASLLAYLLLWYIVALLNSCYMMLLAGIISSVLTMRKKKIVGRTYGAKGNSSHFCIYFSAIFPVVGCTIFMILNMFGIIITPVFNPI